MKYTCKSDYQNGEILRQLSTQEKNICSLDTTTPHWGNASPSQGYSRILGQVAQALTSGVTSNVRHLPQSKIWQQQLCLVLGLMQLTPVGFAGTQVHAW